MPALDGQSRASRLEAYLPLLSRGKDIDIDVKIFLLLGDTLLPHTAAAQRVPQAALAAARGGDWRGVCAYSSSP